MDPEELKKRKERKKKFGSFGVSEKSRKMNKYLLQFIIIETGYKKMNEAFLQKTTESQANLTNKMQAIGKKENVKEMFKILEFPPDTDISSLKE